MPTVAGKDTIYIDIDDEITTVIEKVRASDEKIVALVLPKRASVLQSIVNMKLLKRTADKAKKHVVLITSEAGLLPLAGAVGFFVAKNLQTKPEIPVAPGAADDEEVVDDEPMDGPDEEPEASTKTAGDRPIGELAVAGAISKDDSMETLSMDDSSDDTADVPTDDSGKAKAPKKNRKLAVPSFDKFRLRLILGVAVVILLIVGIYLANVVLPKGTITLTTDTSDINSSLNLTFDTAPKTLDATKLVVPATIQTIQKSGSQQVATTGKQNNGTAATGKVTLSLPDCSVSQVTVPAGTGVTANGLTFITQADADLSSVKVGSSCKNSSFPSFSAATVDVTAQQAGTAYNVPATTFKVAGYSYVAASSNDTMTGGTDNIIQVVAQADIDSATQKIAAQNATAIKSQLATQLKQAALDPIQSTFAAGDAATTVSSKVGDQASTVTVTQTIPYTMFGVKLADLKTLVDNDVQKHINPAKQSILTEGLDKATFHVNGTTATTAQIALTTTATAGPDLNADTIKKQVAGKKSGDIKSLLRGDPGVTQVDVHFSPFWVNKAPKASKLTIIFQKASS